jgi:hemoglobin
MHNGSATSKLVLLMLVCMPLELSDARAETSELPLYTRMGGAPVATALVGDVIDRAARDPQLKTQFEGVNLARVKRHFVELICARGGGGCTYSGDTMHDAHGGLGITEAQFFHLVAIFRDSMRRQDLKLRERNELLEIFAPMKRDIVER